MTLAVWGRYVSIYFNKLFRETMDSMSMAIVVTSNNPIYIPESDLFSSNIHVGNYQAVIMIGSNGEVETTANLTESSSVYLGQNGTCTWATLQMSQQQIIICNNSQLSYATNVTPQSVTTGSVR